MLDQRLLPVKETYIRLTSLQSVVDAIRDMIVRGAPAIGITAAYGVVLAVRQAYKSDPAGWREVVETSLGELAKARPTAVNLHWAIERMRRLFDELDGDPEALLLDEARTIHDEDIAANLHMGELGAEILQGTTSVLTHCNTGSLATGGYGTALGVIRTAYSNKIIQSIYASETRPWLQGARLTAWELLQDKIPCTLIADSAAGHLMRTGEIEWVIVGADRIAANGDVANKIGTYSHAVNARYHGLKFMVVAPTSTVDINMPSGDDIPIEQRHSSELLEYANKQIAPVVTDVFNPVFDITPANLINVIVTEKGIVHEPDEKKMRALLIP